MPRNLDNRVELLAPVDEHRCGAGELVDVPVTGLVLLLGVDRFMNEARAVTNLSGNGIATIAIAKWDGALDRAWWRRSSTNRRARDRPPVLDAEPEPEPLPHR